MGQVSFPQCRLWLFILRAQRSQPILVASLPQRTYRYRIICKRGSCHGGELSLWRRTDEVRNFFSRDECSRVYYVCATRVYSSNFILAMEFSEKSIIGLLGLRWWVLARHQLPVFFFLCWNGLIVMIGHKKYLVKCLQCVESIFCK